MGWGRRYILTHTPRQWSNKNLNERIKKSGKRRQGTTASVIKQSIKQVNAVYTFLCHHERERVVKKKNKSRIYSKKNYMIQPKITVATFRSYLISPFFSPFSNQLISIPRAKPKKPGPINDVCVLTPTHTDARTASTFTWYIRKVMIS